MVTLRRWGALAAGAAIALGAGGHAQAYEFKARSRSTGQLYALPRLELGGNLLSLSRQRFTQNLGLSIWDIGDLDARRRAQEHGLARPGPRLSLRSDLRLDHDVGTYGSGFIIVDGSRFDALDIVPELASTTASLEIIDAYLLADGLWDGRMTAQAGRFQQDDGVAAFAIDGATARLVVAAGVAVEVAGGLRVRDASYLSRGTTELDGTAGAACTEYVEAAAGNLGAWRLIDRSLVAGDRRLVSDDEYCPQRLQPMPTAGVAVDTASWQHVHARLGYRRSWSDTVGVIGSVDRLDVPDRGLYPNEHGQAPASGLDEDVVFAQLDGDRRIGGWGVSGYAGARASLQLDLLDHVGGGVSARHGAHTIDGDVRYDVPVFDADSIFAIFAALPATETSLSYRLAASRRTQVQTRGWMRWLRDDDAQVEAGVQASAMWAVSAHVDLRGLAYGDGGNDVSRLGATAMARWAWRPTWVFAARLGGVRTSVPSTDDGARARGTAAAAGAQAIWKPWAGAQATALVEGAQTPLAGPELRAMLGLDLTFEPEM